MLRGHRLTVPSEEPAARSLPLLDNARLDSCESLLPGGKQIRPGGSALASTST